MKMNYNSWFYAFHQYLKGRRGQIETYNDTNWTTVGDKYQKVLDIYNRQKGSGNTEDRDPTLFDQQPYGMVANRAGFERLLDLMTSSSYQFDDIDDALKKTYDQSLRRAMGKMMVNTHAVIFHTISLNDRRIHNVGFTATYLVDIPYDQMHFGDRDEFIRQKIDRMHDSVNNQYIHMSEFTTNPFTKLLGFSFMCTINGMICNEFYIGFDDHGFRFKFVYGGVADADIIIYKFDEAQVIQKEVTSATWWSSNHDGTFKISMGIREHEGAKCILSIYDDRYRKHDQFAPNFGYIKNGDLVIEHLQSPTNAFFNQYKTLKMTIVLWIPKYFHELHGIFPATNYIDMTHVTPVYTDLGNKVVDINNMEIIASPIEQKKNYEVPICTPPICIDRDYDMQFTNIMRCANFYDFMMSNQVTTFIRDATDALKRAEFKSYRGFHEGVIKPLKKFYNMTIQWYLSYLDGAILTGLIDQETLEKIHQFYEDLVNTINIVEQDWELYPMYINDAFYYDGYPTFIDLISHQYRDAESLQVFKGLTELNEDFFVKESSHRFNRPISEQCFVALRYSREFQCWIFTDPELKHFKGIENSFFINTGLHGDEVFKFFFFYTDTFYPSAKEIDDTFTMETVLDYDQFIKQVEHHLGFIRYWNIENKLMKMAKMLYNKYDDNTVVHILSDILLNKLDPEEVLSRYGSNFTYEPAIRTSEPIYSEQSVRAPFEINYLFYTLGMLKNNEDSLQAFFYRTLTDEKFNPRYMDYDITKIFENQDKIVMNFSKFTTLRITNDTFSNSSSRYYSTDQNCHFYYGLPMVLKNTSPVNQSSYYPYTFTKFNEDENGELQKFPLLVDKKINPDYYVKFNEAFAPNDYYHDIQVLKLMTRYLNAIRDFISFIRTDYKIGFNQTFAIESHKESVRKEFLHLKSFVEHVYNTQPHHLDYDELDEHLMKTEPFVFIQNDCLCDKLIDRLKCSLKDDVWTSSTSPLYKKFRSVYFAIYYRLEALQTNYYMRGYRNETIRRVNNLYLHLKGMTRTNNSYQMLRLTSGYDKSYTDKYMLFAPMTYHESIRDEGMVMYNSQYRKDIFMGQYVTTIMSVMESNMQQLRSLLNQIDELQTTYLHDFETFVDDGIKKCLFNLYVIDKIIPVYQKEHDGELDPWHRLTQQTDVAYLKWKVDLRVDEHQFIPPDDIPTVSSYDLYFYLDPYMENFKYTDGTKSGQIKQAYESNMIKKICEYTFFDGQPMKGVTLEAYRSDGTLIDDLDLTVDITFKRVASTADLLRDMAILLNHEQTPVDLQNVHEDNEYVDQGGMIVSHKTTNTHYEMLLANRYTQLQHDYEMILNPRTYLPGPVDRVWLINSKVNDFLYSEIGNRIGSQLFFKPSQVLHLTPDENGDITSIGHGFFEGQRTYLMTNDELHYIFPVTITSIDHSMSHGFVEAKVDSRHSKWFEIKDSALVTKYLTDTVECTVLNDNISNFLDEFSNGDDLSFTNALFDPELEYCDEDWENMLSFPGDPIFVNAHSDFVYQRFNQWMYDRTPNPQLNEEQKLYHMEYMGDGRIKADEDYFVIQMVNRNRCQLTEPELYPILKDEPNDHAVWEYEKWKFNHLIENLENDLEERRSSIMNDIESYNDPDNTVKMKKQIKNRIEDRRLRLSKFEGDLERYKRYLDEQEHPTTWYNVITYDAAKVYLSNNRTDLPPTFKPDIRDYTFPINGGVQVFLYDWDRKEWIDPNRYDVSHCDYSNYDDLDAYDGYTVSMILKTLYIQSNDLIDGLQLDPSHRILVYFGYKKSDAFDAIQRHDRECQVKFKPILSTNHIFPGHLDEVDHDVYKNLRIRKHVDRFEKYTFHDMTGVQDDLLGSDDLESEFNGKFYRIHRDINHSGRIPYAPVPRFCHLTLTFDGNTIYNVNDLTFFLKLPYKRLHPIADLVKPSYDCHVLQEIDNFQPDEIVKLVVVLKRKFDETEDPLMEIEREFAWRKYQNLPDYYNGNIGEFMFLGKTSYDDDDNQVVTIERSFIEDAYELNGHMTYICYVLHDPDVSSIGGLIKIDVSYTREGIMDAKGQFIKVRGESIKYLPIPEDFAVTPNDQSLVHYSSDATIQIDTSYKRMIDPYTYTINKDNSGLFNPFEFYWNYDADIRYPISSTRHSRYNQRLTYEWDEDTFGKYNERFLENYDELQNKTRVVRTNYLSICRYSLANIPADGFIDVTGYIPTPLSRDRYEFWVNGKQLRGNNNLLILSATSFQLINLTSLRNFELIELVDDYDDNLLSNYGSIYIDTNGLTYSSFKQACLSNNTVLQQDMRYRFNGFPNHTKLQDLTMGFVANPNNVNIEEDIMTHWLRAEQGIEPSKDYNDYYNIPTLNGVQLYHPFTDDLGLHEIPYESMFELFDKAWKKEILTNPLFALTHRDSSMYHDQFLLLHVKRDRNKFIVYTTGTCKQYFTLYLSEREDGNIDQAVKIIPIIRTGTRVELPFSTKGLWLHATVETYSPVKMI